MQLWVPHKDFKQSCKVCATLRLKYSWALWEEKDESVVWTTNAVWDIPRKRIWRGDPLAKVGRPCFPHETRSCLSGLSGWVGVSSHPKYYLKGGKSSFPTSKCESDDGVNVSDEQLWGLQIHGPNSDWICSEPWHKVQVMNGIEFYRVISSYHCSVMFTCSCSASDLRQHSNWNQRWVVG